MTSTILRMQHSSLQFSDRPSQQRHDVKAIFEKGSRFPIKTGTEAGVDKRGRNTNHNLLIEAAHKYNHIINFGADAWVAVDREIVEPGTVRREDVFLVSNNKMVGIGADRVMPTISFDHKDKGVGRIHVGAVHYPTKGAVPGSPNHWMNVKCAEGIQKWLHEVAKGTDLGFVDGDFNMPDNKLDFALGNHFTSMADELKAWQNTGHGPIDGFCSYDPDTRVKAKSFKVLDDHEFHLFSDHFLCHGEWEIRNLKEKA